MQTIVQTIVQTQQQALEFSSWKKHNEIKLHGDLPSMFKNADQHYYCLKVSGDSMMGEEDLARDLILVKRTEEAQNDDIIVSVIDGEVKLKRFKKYENRIELHSANSFEPPIMLTDANDFRIAGVVEDLYHL